jgi:glycosyltransferase involved in cell wall biosynthesis
MAVDLLVVTYNTKDLLKRLLDTLHSDYEDNVWKLFIADNNSQDGTQEWLLANSGEYKIEELVFNENIGYSAAINDLAFRSSSEILCAVNADTWFTTKHVKQVIQSFDDTPNMAVCGVKQMDESNKIRHGGIFWDKKSDPVHRGWSQWDPLDVEYRDKVQCWTVSGSIYYAKRSIWKELHDCPIFAEMYPEAKGAFLPTPHFFEETWFSQHALAHGYEVWYDGTVDTAGHTWHASTAVGEASRKYFMTSRDIYIKACEKHRIDHECK